MKKGFSKLLALLLVFAMAVGFCVISHADEPVAEPEAEAEPKMLLTTSISNAPNANDWYVESATTRLYASSAPKFTDVPQAFWGYDAIQRCADEGIVIGIGNDLFAPDMTLTYAQFYTLMGRAFYDDEIKAATMPSDNWYSASVRYLETNGLLKYTLFNSMARDVYDPAVIESVIPRYEMALLMFNIASNKGCDEFDILNVSGSYEPRPFDEVLIPAWFAKSALWAYRNGLIVGYGDDWFHGEDPVTRAQACTIVCRLLDFIENGEITQGATDPKPTEPPVQPTEPPVQPTEPPVEPSAPPVEPPASTVSYEEVKDMRLKDLSIEDAEAAITDGLFKKINEYRVSLGLNEVPYSEILKKGATIRAEELGVSFSHDRPNGDTAAQLYEECAGGAWVPGENIGTCHTNAFGRTVEFYVDMIFNEWRNSPGHESLMSQEDASLMAVGTHVTRKESSAYESDIYYVLHLSNQSRYEMYLYNAGLGPMP